MPILAVPALILVALLALSRLATARAPSGALILGTLGIAGATAWSAVALTTQAIAAAF